MRYLGGFEDDAIRTVEVSCHGYLMARMQFVRRPASCAENLELPFWGSSGPELVAELDRRTRDLIAHGEAETPIEHRYRSDLAWLAIEAGADTSAVLAAGRFGHDGFAQVLPRQSCLDDDNRAAKDSNEPDRHRDNVEAYHPCAACSGLRWRLLPGGLGTSRLIEDDPVELEARRSPMGSFKPYWQQDRDAAGHRERYDIRCNSRTCPSYGRNLQLTHKTAQRLGSMVLDAFEDEPFEIQSLEVLAQLAAGLSRSEPKSL